MRMRDGIKIAREDLTGNQPSKVCHIDHEDRANLIGQFAHLRKVELAWIRAIASQQYQGAYLVQLSAQLVKVNQLRLRIDAIGRHIKQLAGDIMTIPVCEVAAGIVV